MDIRPLANRSSYFMLVFECIVVNCLSLWPQPSFLLQSGLIRGILRREIQI
jgi:hypothetical protein